MPTGAAGISVKQKSKIMNSLQQKEQTPRYEGYSNLNFTIEESVIEGKDMTDPNQRTISKDE